MKTSTSYYVAIGIVIVALVGYFVMKPLGPGQYDEFAQCLTEKGAVMYGAYWCPHCLNQKKMFGRSWQFVNYVECDRRGDNANPELCAANNVEGYPTWIFADGTRLTGELSLKVLGDKTGCDLPEK
jgi:hypothetical protein